MAGNEARRQKKLQKHKAKRSEKKSLVARLSSVDPSLALQGASDWPVHEALEPVDLWKNGIGSCILARRTPTGKIAYGVYLVDTYCLGVKDCLWRVQPVAVYNAEIQRISKNHSFRNVDPSYVVKLIEDAVDYAAEIGLRPHPDFRKASRILTGIDSSPCREEFQFGKNGKHFYVSGPNESTSEANRIARIVHEAGGKFVLLAGAGGVPALALGTGIEEQHQLRHSPSTDDGAFGR